MWVELRNGAMINLNKASFFRKVNDQEDKNNPEKDLFGIEYIVEGSKPIYETFSVDMERNIRLEFIKLGLMQKNHYLSIQALDEQIRSVREAMKQEQEKKAAALMNEVVKKQDEEKKAE